MKYTKRIAGVRAQKSGASFERALEKAMNRKGWELVRIHNGCKTIGGGKTIRVRQPFDFIGMGPNGENIYFDAKRQQRNKSLTLGVFKGESTEHQRKELTKVALKNRHAGFVVCLDAMNCIFWVPVTKLGKIDIDNAISWGPLSELSPKVPV